MGGDMDKLYLVDVSSLFFRAFFSIHNLSNSKGLPTNAIYGFLSMSVKLLREVKPKYMVYCWDRPEPSFRKNLDPNYKAHRAEMPQELSVQIPPMKKLTELMGIVSMEKVGFEADDLIGSLCQWAVKKKLEVIIVSGDKDFAQLVSQQVTLWDTMRDCKYDPQGVLEKWGVCPEQFIDYLSIVGDSSDNIQGVRGIGPKGAQSLLNKWKSLDGIYKNLESISNGSHQKKLQAGKDMAYLSQKLVTIETGLDLAKKQDDLCLKEISAPALVEFLEELDFSSFKKKLLGVQTESKDQGQNQRLYSIQKGGRLELDSWLQKGEEVLAYRDSRQFFMCQKESIFVWQGELEKISDLLSSKNLLWSGYDIKNLWRSLDLSEGDIHSDLMLSAYLLKPGVVGSFQDLYQTYMGLCLPEFFTPRDWVEAFGKLRTELTNELKKQDRLSLLQTLDLPLIPVLCSMESKGIKLNLNLLKEQGQELEMEISSLSDKIQKQAGKNFNVASPKQLSSVLFEDMKLPKGKKTKTGFSTSTEVLQKLIPQYPIAQDILDFREMSKLKSTYVDALCELAHPRTHRVHTIFNQAITTTGRLSSNHPNLQNIPIRTTRGKKIREAFIASPGHLLLSADYSQIELRILAHTSKDSGLMEAFSKGVDIHSWTACEIFDTSLEQVDEKKRRVAKAVNFGIAYGQGAYGLSETLQIDRKEAKKIIDNYFAKFPGVKTYMESTLTWAREKGFSETLFGRRRYIPELFSKNPMQRNFGDRAAINAPIQGTASDIVKMAMIEIHESFPGTMLLQVHDELVFELEEGEVEKKAPSIEKIMENAVHLDIPLKVNLSWGAHWAQAH